jgi:hypothetical protein
MTRFILVAGGAKAEQAESGEPAESKRGSKKGGKQIKTIALTIQKKDVQVACEKQRVVRAVAHPSPGMEGI